MTTVDVPHAPSLEAQIAQWRSFLGRRREIHALEDHLRVEIDTLVDDGLSPDEAFLVPASRMGAQNAIANEFAREHSERIWKQLVAAPNASESARGETRHETLLVFALAAASALLVKVPALFGLQMNADSAFYLRNLGLFVLPLLTGYFVWKRQVDLRLSPCSPYSLYNFAHRVRTPTTLRLTPRPARRPRPS